MDKSNPNIKKGACRSELVREEQNWRASDLASVFDDVGRETCLRCDAIRRLEVTSKWDDLEGSSRSCNTSFLLGLQLLPDTANLDEPGFCHTLGFHRRDLEISL